jgi:CheY-like chemotaxis protein
MERIESPQGLDYDQLSAFGTRDLALIVDDDIDTVSLLKLTLQREGINVIGALDGDEAIEKCSEAKPNVILLDLMMPVMNGWQFRSAQASDPKLSRIPVVVVTAAGSRDDIPAIDASAWLAKPVDLDRLLATIRPLCNP